MGHHINLLIGFDAMRAFLRAQWEAEEKQSDDLANLLGDMNRDAWANGQPLDIAQWSDWLDAVLLVQPDLSEVKDARRQLQEDYQKFRQILEMEPTMQQEKLYEYRAEAALQTWHRIGYWSMSILDAYEAMRAFLSAYWSRGGRRSRDFSIILNSLNDQEATPGVAQWDKWLAAVRTAEAEVDQQHRS